MLLAALGQQAGLKDGDPLPILHHWLHDWEARTPASTGFDGHSKRGDFLPPVPLPCRMWAGGRLTFHAPLLLGENVRKVSTIKYITAKTGRSGTLVFVTVTHRLHGPSGLAIEEEQDLVYRDIAVPAARQPEPAMPEPIEMVMPDAVLLFRYSALTMNSHRIHYDHPYAIDTEGYSGLVVQGPLQATLLASLAQREAGRPLRAFGFRGRAPAFADHLLGLHATENEKGFDLSISQKAVRTMSAVAEAS